MFYGYILGMDTFALGLIKAAEIIESKTVDGFIKKKYASFNSELGQKSGAEKRRFRSCPSLPARKSLARRPAPADRKKFKVK